MINKCNKFEVAHTPIAPFLCICRITNGARKTQDVKMQHIQLMNASSKQDMPRRDCYTYTNAMASFMPKRCCFKQQILQIT